MTVTAAATFCATIVDEWARAGMTDAVICPGSRSTPVALAVAADGRLRVHVHHDERSAGFVALGLGLGSGRPALVLTTSGTAAVELHPAVVEAHHAGVPLVAVTADRPPELRDVGAPQTIDQARLFGHAVRWYADPGVPDASVSRTWRPLAARVWAEATGPLPGPVHLNLPFRDPLVGEPGALPEPLTPSVVRAHTTTSVRLDEVVAVLESARGVIVAGAGCGDPELVAALGAAAGWPVLADPRSGCRGRDAVVCAYDDLLRHARFATDHRPAVVLRLGAPPASKVLAQWLAASGARQVAVVRPGEWLDPEHTASLVVAADPTWLVTRLLSTLRGGCDTPWLARWSHAESLAQHAIESVLDGHAEPTEPGVARSLLRQLPAGTPLVVSSSMPIRDVEWYGPPDQTAVVLANRGANGIDGVTSTAVGVALGAGRPTVALLGDVALLHDTNGMLGATSRGVDLVLAVVDNDGGGIFHFLPQATEVEPAVFDRLFGTPHGVDLDALALAHGLTVHRPEAGGEVVAAVLEALEAGGVHLVHVRTDRRANVAVHDEIHRAVQSALG